MPDAWAVRGWLMTMPRPTSVRLTLKDGTRNELVCGAQPWARIAQTIIALEAQVLEALDTDARLVRAAKISEIIAGGSDEEEAACSSTGVSAPPAVMPPNVEKGMMAVLDKFGTLLAGAYQHAVTIAFDQMVAVVNIQTNATVSMQRELMQARVESRKLERELIEQAFEQAEQSGEAGDMLRQLISGYMQGQASRIAGAATTAVAGKAGAAAPKPPPTNGKGSTS